MSIRVNLISNFSGSIWNTALILISVPIYLNYLGIEAYGLIGFYTLLMSLFFHSGYGVIACNDKRNGGVCKSPDKISEMKDFARTLELLYWGIGLAAGALILICSGAIGNHLSKSSSYESDELSQVVMLLALLIFARWPMAFYSGGFMGLEKQLFFNILNSAIESCKVLTSVVAMLLLGKNIHVFLLPRY